MSSILLNGFLLGWSVAWPPGPINAETIRRMVLPRESGGGFWAAQCLGLGACTGDFTWALAVSAGAGALLNRPAIRTVLGFVSLILLMFLAGMFIRAAWHGLKKHRAEAIPAEKAPSKAAGARTPARTYLLGLTFALSSPWNIGFWLAVIGGQRSFVKDTAFLNSVLLASSVVLGAIAWSVMLCTCLRLGARIFARPSWQIGTQALSAMVMLWFAVRLSAQLIHQN